MAGVRFKVEIDLEKIEKLKTKINELKTEIGNMKTSDAGFKQLEKDLQKAEKQVEILTKQVQQAGAGMQDMGKSGAEGIQNVNQNLKQAITEQKQLIKEIKRDVDDLNSKSKDKSLSASQRQEAQADLQAAKKALAEEKGTLIGMQRKQIEMNTAEEASQASLVSKLGKWAIGLFSVSTAMEVGKKIMESAEATTHMYESITAQASAATEFFFKTVATGDWGNFFENLGKAIMGAKEYVDTMEQINNLSNEQKVRSSVLDVKIGEAFAESYSLDPKVQKKALQEIIKLNEEKYRGEAKIARDTYEARVKEIAERNGMNEKDLENTIVYYSKRRKIIEEGEKYNELKATVDRSTGSNKNRNTSGIPDMSAVLAAQEARAELAKMPKQAAWWGSVAQDFSKVTFPERNEVADLLAASNTAESQINLNNKRIRLRLRGIEMQEQTAAAAAAKAAQDERDRKSLEKIEYEREVGQRRIQTAFDIERQKIEIESDGYEKSSRLAELNHRQALATIEQQKAEMLRKQNEVSGGIDKKSGKRTKLYSSVLNATDQAQIDQMSANAELEYNTTLHKNLLREFETFQQKRERIAKDYDAKIIALAGDPAAKGEAEFQKQQALDEIDKQVASRSAVYAKWSKELSKKTLDDLSGLLTSYETMSVQLNKGGNLSEDERAVLREQIRTLQAKIQELSGGSNVAKESKKDWTENLRTMNEVNEMSRNIISSFDGMDSATKQVLASITNMASGLIQVAETIHKLETATSALTIAEKASAMLTIFSVALQVYNQIKAAFRSIGDANAAADEAIRNEYLNIVSYNEELRQKYEWTKKIGETTLDYLKREGEELAKQGVANGADQANLWDKLQKSNYVDYRNGWGKSRSGQWGYGYTKGNISLEGQTYEQIAQLSVNGKLSKEAEAYYQALKKAKEEGADILKMQEEYLQKVKETYTGTTQEAITSSIINGFREGKRSAADFASTFEDLMREAMLQSLALMSEEGVKKWYDDFAAASESGGELTAEEIAKLKKDYEYLVAKGAKRGAELEKITGVSLTGRNTSGTTSGSSGTFTTMSQDTASALEGRFTAVQMASEGTREGVRSMDAKMGIMVDRQIEMSDTAKAQLEAIGNIRTIQIKNMEHLENIAKYTKVLPDMAEDIKSVKRNTEGLSNK